MNDVTSDGERLIKSWMNATEKLSDAKANINRFECAVTNTRNARGKSLNRG